MTIARKAIKKAAGDAERLVGALRAIDKAGEDPFARMAGVGQARKAAAGLHGLDKTLVAVEDWLDAIGRDATAEAERSRAQLMGDLDDELRNRGHRLSGRLPTLECGPLTIELALADKAELRIWYGPKIARLGTAPLDAPRAAAMVSEVISGLSVAIDDEAFLREVQAAWRAAVARAGGAPGDRPPIVSVLGEMAAGRQSVKWARDPVKSAYREYTRVQFSFDLGRLRTRRVDDAELQLTVATRDQTKSASDHLWVAGTHYAFVSFR